MDKSNTLTILKHAFLMEQKGKSLYLKAMEHTQNEEMKSFFKDLADDEQEHMDILGKQFKSYMNSGKFIAGGFENNASVESAPDILSEDLKGRINAAGFEATAITAAIYFEQKAVQMYADRAKKCIGSRRNKDVYLALCLGKNTLKQIDGN